MTSVLGMHTPSPTPASAIATMTSTSGVWRPDEGQPGEADACPGQQAGQNDDLRSPQPPRQLPAGEGAHHVEDEERQDQEAGSRSVHPAHQLEEQRQQERRPQQPGRGQERQDHATGEHRLA